MLNIALPKGRLGDQVYEMLRDAGYDCPDYEDKDRLLVLESPEKGVRYLLVKPSDVAIYVEHHAADVGIVGKDILLENGPDVYELLDLNIGKCRMAVAAPRGYVEDPDRTLRIATKYVNVAKRFYSEKNRDIEIIKLNGSIELAPILGLSDVIVDIVETGSTLKANNLEVIEEFKDISARFIANKSSFKFQNEIISDMMNQLGAAVK
ncbi:MAG: ATP phosphoribosyltransferase [Firmicutes bacterium]|jgi:ATP phosphoribosyltransferase|nr:ATP phosphoribosyltransferase [Bacillota bacterium]NBI62447.1 ATP phosphoribosyltransferase [Clostridiales bacterium]